MSDPLVTVLMPCYNAGAFLRASLVSILRQTYKNLEIIIIDDGSCDNCLDTISDLDDPRIQVLRQENRGPAGAKNRGLDACTGEFWLSHDVDDLSYPRRIERQLKVMLDRSELAATFVDNDLIIEGRVMAPRQRLKEVAECRCDVEMLRLPAMPPTGMYRTSYVKGMRFSDDLPVGEDVDFVLRVGEKYPVMCIGECLYTYRVHPGSITRRDFFRNYRMEREVFSRACRRRGWNPDERLPSEPRRLPAVLHRQRERGVVPHFIESVLDLRRTGRSRESLQNAVACWKLHPLDPYYYRPLIYALAPVTFITGYRAMKAGRRG